MFAAVLLTISVVALSQFGLYYWRAVLAAVAGQAVSEGVLAAARVDNRNGDGRGFCDFRHLARTDADARSASGRVGFREDVLSMVDTVCGDGGKRLPGLARGAIKSVRFARVMLRCRSISAADELSNGRVASLLLTD